MSAHSLLGYRGRVHVDRHSPTRKKREKKRFLTFWQLFSKYNEYMLPVQKRERKLKPLSLFIEKGGVILIIWWYVTSSMSSWNLWTYFSGCHCELKEHTNLHANKVGKTPDSDPKMQRLDSDLKIRDPRFCHIVLHQYSDPTSASFLPLQDDQTS